MRKRDSHILFVEISASPSVLLSGFSGALKEVLIEHLQKYGCDIYEQKNDINYVNFSYIFQKNSLNQLTKNLILANKNNARFVLLVTDKNPRVSAKIKELLSQIRGNIQAHFFSYPETSDYTEAKKIVDEIFTKVFSGEDLREEYENQVSPKKTAKKTLKKQFVFKPAFFFLTIFLTIFFGLLIYSAAVFLPFYYGIKNLDITFKEFSNGNLALGKKSADDAYKLFSLGNKVANFSLPLVKAINYQEAKTVEDGFKGALLLAKTLSEAIYLASMAQNIGESVFSSRTSLHSSQLESFKTEMQELNKNVLLLIASVKSMQRNPSRIYRYLNAKRQLEKGEEVLQQTNELLSLSTKIIQVLPEILGYDKPKTFLLLFQNNSELRPTGGFIGSFGWVTFSNGRLIDFKTEDVYTADGQLKGYVPPPEPIKKYLAQENWYLRDSNFDPDFLVSANQAEWFLKHELNLSFDGVFAFDLNSVQGILRSLEGVYLSDYGQTITADNLFLKTQAVSEMDFFPGSTQKRDFLGSLGRAIFIKLTTNKIAWSKLIKEVKSSLDNKHILLYFHNESSQQLVEEAGWAGRIASVSCQQKNCLSDYLMIVEANLGINKANFFLERNANLNISVSGNNLLHELLVDYSNQSPGQVYPSGPYFSYTRVLLPKEALVTEMAIEGEVLKKEDVIIEQYQDKVSVGFPFKVNAQETRKVRLVYSLPSSPNNSNLELLVQKQPGINPFTLDLLVNSSYPTNKSITISGDHLLSLPL